MGKSKWDKFSAIDCIKRAGGHVVGNGIIITQPGIKVLGAIDYLVNHCKMIRAVPDEK
jgi:hypothetical protein